MCRGFRVVVGEERGATHNSLSIRLLFLCVVVVVVIGEREEAGAARLCSLIVKQED